MPRRKKKRWGKREINVLQSNNTVDEEKLCLMENLEKEGFVELRYYHFVICCEITDLSNDY